MDGNVREKPRFSQKILPRAAGNKKITVVDMVSTTVTDMVAEGGLEPPTSGL